MRLYAEKILNVFYIEGVSFGPVTDFVVDSSGSTISIYRPSLGYYDIVGLDYSLVQNKDGNGFASIQQVLIYLNEQLTPTTLHAQYPLILDEATGVLSVDKADITDGNNF